jgi:FkbM family methyltransferase
MEYYSQSYQDKFIDRILFRQKENGVFVEIGAYDGISFSNSFFFEKNRSWRGICIEPTPRAFNELCKNRKCICVNGCISDSDGEAELILLEGYSAMLSGLKQDYDPRHSERIENEIKRFGGEKKSLKVRTINFNNLMLKYGTAHIDYCSIDVEGGEWKILQSINFDIISIDVITVENNFSDSRFIDFLANKGYDYVGKLEADQVFIRQGRSDLRYLKRMCKEYNMICKLNHFFSRVLRFNALFV